MHWFPMPGVESRLMIGLHSGLLSLDFFLTRFIVFQITWSKLIITALSLSHSLISLTHSLHHRLKYNSSTGEYSNNDGVETRIPDFGGTSSIEYLDPDSKFSDTTNAFHDMVQWFVDKGYTRGKDIVGAPYDWRYSPSELQFVITM